jgi:outer membrane lipoprotein SlyB
MAVLGSSSPIKSIQRGTTLSSSAPTVVNVTITAVDLDKSFVSGTNQTGYLTNGASANGIGGGAGATLTTTTNLAVTGGTTFYSPGTLPATLHWEVIEYV